MKIFFSVLFFTLAAAATDAGDAFDRAILRNHANLSAVAGFINIG